MSDNGDVKTMITNNTIVNRKALSNKKHNFTFLHISGRQDIRHINSPWKKNPRNGKLFVIQY